MVLWLMMRSSLAPWRGGSPWCLGPAWRHTLRRSLLVIPGLKFFPATCMTHSTIVTRGSRSGLDLGITALLPQPTTPIGLRPSSTTA